MPLPLEKYKARTKEKFQAYVSRYAEDLTINFSWGWVSRSPYIDLDFIRKWRDKSWCWWFLSANPSISLEDKIKTKAEFPWRWAEIINNFQDYELVKDQVFSIESFSLGFSHENKNIIEDVEKYPNFPWNWVAISNNVNISEDFAVKYKKQLIPEYLAGNKAISIEFLRTSSWPLRWIANNQNVNDQTFHLLFDKKSFKCNECRDNLTSNHGISMNFILSNPQYDWNSELINYRDDITEEHIKNYPFFPWDWKLISGCSSIDKEFLKSHPKVSLEDLYIFHNGMTIDEVEELHLTPRQISSNSLLGSKKDKIKFLREYYAVRRIEQAFLDCYWLPTYRFCRNRLEKEYEEMFGT